MSINFLFNAIFITGDYTIFFKDLSQMYYIKNLQNMMFVSTW